MPETRAPQRYLSALRERWLLIALVVLVSVGTTLGFSRSAQKRYEARADVVVMPLPAADDTFVGLPVLRESDQSRSVLTIARLVQSPQIADLVRRRSGLHLDRDTLLASVAASPQEQSNVVTITGTSSTPRGAVRIANGFASALIEQRTSNFQTALKGLIRRLTRAAASERDPSAVTPLLQRLSALRSLVAAPDPTVQVLSRAVVPRVPSWPRPVLSTIVAFVGALLFGAGLAVGLDLIRPVIRREEDLLGYRVPIIARIPRVRQKVIRGYFSDFDTDGRLPAPLMYGYQNLKIGLATGASGRGMPRTILVISAMRGDGKTFTAINLAKLFALAGKRVAVVEPEFRKFALATPGSNSSKIRSSTWLMSEKVGESLLSAAGSSAVPLLESRERDSLNPVLSDGLRSMISGLKTHADVVIFDSQPLTEVMNALLLAEIVDAVLVAVRLGHTRRDRLEEVSRMLVERNVAPFGIVVTTRTSRAVGEIGLPRAMSEDQRHVELRTRADAGPSR
jgi:receptor protein-tyrosine kinase